MKRNRPLLGTALKAPKEGIGEGGWICYADSAVFCLRCVLKRCSDDGLSGHDPTEMPDLIISIHGMSVTVYHAAPRYYDAPK
ncbi:MAG: hypothetical protein ACERKO_00755, partial [Acetanaerobacterium sp.]